MKVPLVDLRASLAPIKQDLFREFASILDEMALFLGPNVQAFEREFAAHCDVEHGVAVSSGTDALTVTLRALDIGPGDEVIVPSQTFFASIEAIIHCGAIPVMVDVEEDVLTMDPHKVRMAITPATKVIMPVHLFGHPADMDPLLQIARDNDLRVVEDAAQAHGARYEGRRCGSMGDAAAFSFYFTKNLGAYGEAGFVTTRDSSIAERVRQARNHGHISKFEHAQIGYNLRIDELQASVLRLKLPRLDKNNQRRVALARRYDQLLADEDVKPLRPRPNCEPVYHLYPIRVAHRDALRSFLHNCGIGTGIHYKIPAHRQPALREHPHRYGDMTVTDRASSEILSIPMYPELTDEQVNYVAEQILSFLHAH